MTIAVCFWSPEGVVLGADSTTTLEVSSPHGERYLNHAQKIFQVDDAGTLGIATWGAAGFGMLSHRTVIARLGARLRTHPPQTVRDAADEWAALVWRAARDAFADDLKAVDAIIERTVPGAAGPPATPEEQQVVAVARNFYVGFYVAGRNVSDHSPDAYRVELQGLIDRPRVERLGRGWNMNGSTALACRILRGWDPALVDAVLAARAPVPPAPSEQSALAQGAPALAAPLWSGSRGELEAALAPLELPVPPNLPIREAVDFVHFVVQATVKSLKFGRLPPGVGGPVELAIITSDRPFRWVKHKTFDAAL